MYMNKVLQGKVGPELATHQPFFCDYLCAYFCSTAQEVAYPTFIELLQYSWSSCDEQG